MNDLRPADRTAELSKRADVAARIVALATVAAFVVYPWLSRISSLALTFDLLALLALVAVIVLRNGDTDRLGFRLHPVQGWWHWCRLAIWIGLAISAVLLVGRHLPREASGHDATSRT